jgi:NAD(P)H-dependent flavin oxidoreductase YrpB (nitropropane dioxygenase family)
MKMTINVEDMPKEDWIEYLELCGWTLARAHARTGDAAQIAGYLGSSEAFDEAVAKFAFAYADQTQRDHEMFVKAVRSGMIKASSKVAG